MAAEQRTCAGLVDSSLLARTRQEAWQQSSARVQGWWKAHCRCDAVLVTSALKGHGVREVKDWMVDQLPEGPTLYPKKLVSEHPEKFFVAEIVREHVFQLYREEVPYCVQVCFCSNPFVVRGTSSNGTGRRCPTASRCASDQIPSL